MSPLEFRLPDLGEGLEHAEIVGWLVEEGATVTRDQPLVAVSTDKAVVELPSPVAGTVRLRRGAEGERIRVGEVIAVIEPVGHPAAVGNGAGHLPAAPAAVTPPPSRAGGAPARRRARRRPGGRGRHRAGRADPRRRRPPRRGGRRGALSPTGRSPRGAGRARTTPAGTVPPSTRAASGGRGPGDPRPAPAHRGAGAAPPR